MITRKINIDSIEKIQSFVKIINQFSGRFDLISGCSKVNARSIMGIFSLDISKPLDLNIYNDESADYILTSISSYVIKSTVPATEHREYA